MRCYSIRGISFPFWRPIVGERVPIQPTVATFYCLETEVSTGAPKDEIGTKLDFEHNVCVGEAILGAILAKPEKPQGTVVLSPTSIPFTSSLDADMSFPPNVFPSRVTTFFRAQTNVTLLIPRGPSFEQQTESRRGHSGRELGFVRRLPWAKATGTRWRYLSWLLSELFRPLGPLYNAPRDHR